MAGMKTYFISGHLDLTAEEFMEHYLPQIARALNEPDVRFVVGDARGADSLAQAFLFANAARYTGYHIGVSPRNNFYHAPMVGGFETDEARDRAMTVASDADIAWVRPGREQSGTARNLNRRSKTDGNAITTATG